MGSFTPILSKVMYVYKYTTFLFSVHFGANLGFDTLVWFTAALLADLHYTLHIVAKGHIIS